MTENIDKEFEKYLEIIERRDNRLLKEIKTVNSLDELVTRGVIYPKTNAKLYRFFEKEMLKKHIMRLYKLGKIDESLLEKLGLEN